MTEKITARIIADAKAEAAAIVAAAEKKAAELIAGAERDKEALIKQVKDASKDQMAEAERRYLATAELEAKKQRLAMKIEVIDRAFEAAETAFLALDKAEYTRVYQTAVGAAVSTGTEGIAPLADEVHIDAAFIDGVNAALQAAGKPASVTLLPPERTPGHGVMVKEGDMEINLSTQALLRQVRETSQREVATLLFPEVEAGNGTKQ